MQGDPTHFYGLLEKQRKQCHKTEDRLQAQTEQLQEKTIAIADMRARFESQKEFIVTLEANREEQQQFIHVQRETLERLRELFRHMNMTQE